MLINLEDFDGNRTAILVNEFRIANEDSGYRIFYKNFSSPVGRSLPARGTKFRYLFFNKQVIFIEYSQVPNKQAARLFVFWKIFPTTRLIRTYTLINFRGKFLPTLLKRVGKIIFYLVPSCLLGPTRLLNSKKFSHLHDFLGSTIIRDLRVVFYDKEPQAFPIHWSSLI